MGVVRRLPFSDPGGETVNAPVGSVAWAQRVRLEMQGEVHDLPKTPERFARYKALCDEHRLWTLLNKRDGATFRTWDEFCAYEEPWGLGKPAEEIAKWLEPLVGKRKLERVTVAPAVEDVRAESGQFTPSPHREGTDKKAHATTERLRAINRAPEAIRALYDDGLIGQTVAAQLGPDRPTPDQAARIAEVTEAVRDLPRPAKPIERKRLQREVNATVRKALGTAPDPLEQLIRAVERLAPALNDAQRERLRAAVLRALEA